jgi:hypothetical protein
MTTLLIEIVFALSCLLGQYLLVVRSQWQLQSLAHLLFYCILLGSLGVGFMLGALIVGNHLACLLTTYC